MEQLLNSAQHCRKDHSEMKSTFGNYITSNIHNNDPGHYMMSKQRDRQWRSTIHYPLDNQIRLPITA